MTSSRGVAQGLHRYYMYVCAESEDEVALLRFDEAAGGGSLEVVKSIPVGSYPADIEGPHGITVHPDGRSWYVSVAHGNPMGSVHKYATGTDEWLADVRVGLFPASMDISRTTGLLYVVNFNLHGDMVPSTVSVIETGSMSEVARPETGIMPHGTRLDASGRKAYHVTMMGDELVELDALTFEVARTLPLSEHAGHAMGGPDEAAAMMKQMLPMMVQPTWVSAPTSAGKVYVAGNNKASIFEVDLDTWAVTRTFTDTGAGPYNLDVTTDGKTLVVTYKKAASIGIWDLETGKETARIDTTRTVPHGVALSPDGRYAFVTVEGVGGEPGTVEAYDLKTRKRVAAADIGKQAGGIAFWKVE
jgi:DNA-binding beta-propeller fold protein YncE